MAKMCGVCVILAEVVVYIHCMQVEATYPELAELLLVVIKTILSRHPQFTVDRG